MSDFRGTLQNIECTLFPRYTEAVSDTSRSRCPKRPFHDETGQVANEMRPHEVSAAEEARVPTAIHYPESDGEPMGETDFHINVSLYLRQALRYFFRGDERTYVAGNLLFYYEEGDPKAVKSPDVFVVKGIAKHDRRIYKLWEEKVVPCVVFEVTSRRTRLEDQGTKRALYEMLGVREYFLFDPLKEYLAPALQGFMLVGKRYEPMDPASDGTLRSDALNLILRPEGNLLRLVDPVSGTVVPTLEEAAERAEKATRRAEEAAERAEKATRRAEEAETEVARLEAELERQRRRSP